ncbi:unnamed protein product, partial [Meganyctiphanes norvegica]
MSPASEKELGRLSDEEYLIFRAKEEQNKDPCAAKCWLITAQALFPKNFGIQFEVYQIEKAAKNVKEAAKCLGTLLREFPRESILWREVDAIMLALRQTTSDSQVSFLIQLFHTLPKDVQLGLVLSAAERCQDTMTHCRLMLLLTTKFPETRAEQGLKLVETLLSAEKHTTGPMNPFRKMLVVDLLPCLLETSGLEVRPKILHNLLSRSIEFFVAYVTTPAKTTQGMFESEKKIEDPWQRLFSIVQLIGWNLGWELSSGFDNVSNREVILQRIQSFVEGGARLGGPKGDGGEDMREVLYTTLTIFLHALTDYIKRLYPDFNQDAGVGITSPPLTLVEAFIVPDREREESVIVPPKRSRQSLDEDPNIPIITVSRLYSTNPSGVPPLTPTTPTPISAGGISPALITAIKCWDLLNAYDTLRAEFMRLLDSLGTERWWWLQIFLIDLRIYQGHLTEAARELRHSLSRMLQASPPNPADIIVMNLKLASVLYAINNLSGAAEAVLEVIPHLPNFTGGGLTPELSVSASPNRRHLHMLALTRPQCLQFITTLLLHALRQRIMADRHHDDLCIGHLITLLQYEWPKYESVFEEVVQIMKKQGGFSYQLFYTYVTTPDILEEFMYLATKEGGNLQLDIIPVNHSNKKQRLMRVEGLNH